MKKEVTCNKCSKRCVIDLKHDSFNVDMIDKNINTTIEEYENMKEGKLCGCVDYVIDDDSFDVPVYEQRCKGSQVIKEHIVQMPQILTVVASKHCQCDIMFFDDPVNFAEIYNDGNFIFARKNANIFSVNIYRRSWKLSHILMFLGIIPTICTFIKEVMGKNLIRVR